MIVLTATDRGFGAQGGETVCDHTKPISESISSWMT
jgi:hypothetical protein